MNKERIKLARDRLAKLTDAEIERLWLMVVDACAYQQELADAYAHMRTSKEFKWQTAEAGRYRRMREKIFPKVETQIETAMRTATSVSIYDIKPNKKFGKPE